MLGGVALIDDDLLVDVFEVIVVAGEVDVVGEAEVAVKVDGLVLDVGCKVVLDLAVK